MRRPKPVKFPFIVRRRGMSVADPAPWLPIRLMATFTVADHGLIDSGASISLLPYSVGIALGLDWDGNRMLIPVGGFIPGTVGKFVTLRASVAPFDDAELGFVWVENDSVPLILGRVNFLQQFDVCLFGSKHTFEIRPRA